MLRLNRIKFCLALFILGYITFSPSGGIAKPAEHFLQNLFANSQNNSVNLHRIGIQRAVSINF